MNFYLSNGDFIFFVAYLHHLQTLCLMRTFVNPNYGMCPNLEQTTRVIPDNYFAGYLANNFSGYPAWPDIRLNSIFRYKTISGRLPDIIKRPNIRSAGYPVQPCILSYWPRFTAPVLAEAGATVPLRYPQNILNNVQIHILSHFDKN